MMWSKLWNWIDDNIIWYVYDKPIQYFKTIKYWFYCNWNKTHLKLVKDAITSYPWDYCFIYRLMEDQIDKQLKWFETHDYIENSETRILRPLKVVKHCLHAMNNDTDLYEYNWKTKEKTYTGPRLNYRNLKRYVNFYKLEFNGNFNTNYNDIIKYYDSYPEEYYQLKCRNILFYIMNHYSMGWWD